MVIVRFTQTNDKTRTHALWFVNRNERVDKIAAVVLVSNRITGWHEVQDYSQ